MGDPIRILHVVVNMNRGGAETLIMNLYRNIDRSKVQFDFLTCKEGTLDNEILAMGGKVHRIPYVSEVGYFKYIKALDHFFSLYKEYTIVHSHMDKMSGFVLRSAEKAGISKRIAHSHSTISEGSFVARVFKWYAGLNIEKNATHCFACSKEAAKWLFLKNMNKVDILNNGIEFEKFKYDSEIRKSVRSELGVSPEHYIIGHVGRFSHPKNHTFLIDVFADVLKIRPDSTLILVGDGPLRHEIEEKARKLNLWDKTKLLGVRDDINRILQSFDILLFPSLYEGLPVTLVEAQGSGLSCVISDTITRDVDLGAGLIQFESLNNSPADWAEKVTKFKDRVEDIQGLIQRKGFDIRGSARWLENFYLDQSAN